MKGRETRRAPSADLLVCFPSRAHLTLMPKPLCSPARPSEPSKPHQNLHHHRQQRPHHLKKFSPRGGGSRASPLLWNKTKQMESELSEPTSPKVTCAGQIKVRHKASSSKNWQSVMEEIERIHNRKRAKKTTWLDSLGFKKDIMRFLTCLRNIRFDFRCFGSFPAQSDITSNDEEEDEEYGEYQENHAGAEGRVDNEDSRTVFSKWFMMLQENHNSTTTGFFKEDAKQKERSCNDESLAAPSVPPPNALLLMRCRSAPAKSVQEEKEEEEEEESGGGGGEEQDRKQEEKKGKNLKALMEEEGKNSPKESLVVMSYDTDFYKLSTDIAKETWVVGGVKDTLARSRSWKR